MKNSAVPPVVKRGRGVYLELECGREIIDAISSWWVNLHGHCHPRLIEAIQQQSAELEHVMLAGLTHQPAIDLSSALSEILPEGLDKVFFSDSGSTAVEISLKIALQYWRNLGQPTRKRFFCFEGGYHGDTFGAMSVAGPSAFNEAWYDLCFASTVVPYPIYHADRDPAAYETEVLDHIATKLEQHASDYAGMICEPLVQGAGGMRMARPQFFRALRQLCDTYGILLIFDEVLTGFGRTGDWFAAQKIGVCPDLIALSKGLTGGCLPMGATVAHRRLWDAFYSDDPRKAFYHSHSYMANPISCAVALASYQLLKEGEERFKGIEARHRRFLEGIKAFPQVEQVRACGAIAAFNIRSDKPGGYFNPAAKPIAERALEKGVLIRPTGDCIYILPPYCISDDELERVYSVVQQAMDEVFSAGSFASL
jgi:adenosylmethionine-8-amino-7-oxononanoate aminotransferase